MLSQNKFFNQAVHAQTIAIELLKEQSKDINFKDLGQIRKWIWEHKDTYTSSELCVVSKLSKDKFRNLVYGLGLAYPVRPVHNAKNLLKFIPADDIPIDAKDNTAWLVYAVNKYTKSAVAVAIGYGHSKDFIDHLKKHGIMPLAKPRDITETELRESLLAQSISEAAKYFGVHEHHIRNLMIRHGIPQISNSIMMKCQIQDESRQKNENHRTNSVTNFISRIKAAGIQPKK